MFRLLRHWHRHQWRRAPEPLLARLRRRNYRRHHPSAWWLRFSRYLSLRCRLRLQDYDAQTTRAGFRDSTGVRTTDTNGRQQALGVNVDKDIIREIHRQRRANWEATARDLNSLRQQVRSGLNPQLPGYIADVKEQLRNVEQLLPSID